MEPFDRTVIAIMGVLVAAIAVEALLGDRVGAGVAAVTPSDGSSPSIMTPIKIEFTQPMDQPSIEKRLTITPAAAGKIQWNGSTLLYLPSRPLAVGQHYEVTLVEGGQSLLRRPMSHGLHWTFTPRSLSVVYLAPANGDLKGLWMIPKEGGAPREVYHPESGVDSFAVRPDGSQIAVTVIGAGEAADIWLLNPWTGSATQITRCAPDYCGRAAWSPDGQRIAFERRQSGSGGEGATSHIWLYDLSSAQTTSLFQDRNLPGYGPEWSPDGGRLAFFDPQAQAIDAVDLSSGAIVYLPSQMGDMGSFSPDGSKMVYEDFRPVGSQVFSELWLGDVSSSAKITALFDQAEEDQFPAWSPDGQWVAFGRRRIDRQGGLGSQLMLVNPSTSELRQITTDPAYNNTAFSWSPAGDALLVQRFDMQSAPGGAAIWSYQIASGKLSMLVSNGFDAAWLP